MAGVVEATVATMRSLGATEVSAVLGPCIAPHAYRFSAPDLGPVAERFGPAVVALDSSGFPALDLPAAVRAALDRANEKKKLILISAASRRMSWPQEAQEELAHMADLIEGELKTAIMLRSKSCVQSMTLIHTLVRIRG